MCNLPTILGSNHKGTELKLKVEGIPFETSLKLELVIHGQDGKILHTGCLRFFPNGIFTLKPQITSFDYGIFEAATGQVSYTTVQLTTFGGIGHQLDVVDDDFDTDAQALLMLLNLWNVDHHPGRTKACKFRIKVAFDPDHKDNEQFWTSMEGLKTENLPNIRKPLHAYCHNNGRPAITLGTTPSRKAIRNAHDSLVKYRFKKSFSHPYEYGVVMANGAFLEHQRELQLITVMQRSLHQMTVYDYEGTIVVAIALSEELDVDDRYRVTPGSNVTINWKRQGTSVSGSKTVRGIIYDHWFAGIPEKYTVVVVNPESLIYVEDLAQKVAAPGRKFYKAKIIFDVNEIPVRRRIDAVNKLIGDNFSSWHPAIMARSSASLMMRDLTDCFQPDHPLREQMIKRAFDKILSSSNLNPDQRNAFNMIRSAPGGIIDIEGCPGGGKTWLLVIIALALRELNIYVLFATPTHAAADAIMETSKMVAKATGLTLEIKRAYSSPHETEAFFTEAKQEGVFDKGLDLAEISKNDNMRTVVLLKTITALRKEYASKRYALTEDSLEQAVIDKAKAKQTDVHFPMTAADHVLVHEELGIPLPPDFSDKKPGKVFPVRVYELINLFLDLMERTPKVEEWTDGLEAICTKAFKWAQEDIVRECGCIVTTTNNVAGTPIANGVGALPEYAGIVALIDESNRGLEQDTAIVLTDLKQSKKLQGVILAGDAKQPPPLVLTDNETPAYNEMSAQIAVSLPSRIVKAGHPQATLKYNGRAHPELNDWPNKNNYYGMLTDTEAAKALPLNKNYEAAIRMLVKQPDPKISVRLVVLSVPDSYCFTPAGSTSKVNYANVRTVVSLVAGNYRAGGYSAEDILIMSPWAKQAEALSSNLLQLALSGAVPHEHIPKVKTVHGMQGGQAKCIIFDGTVSHADRKGDVGHICNEELFNVAITRAREAAIILLPHGLASGQLAAKFWRRINGPPGGDRLHGIAPIAYIHDMNAEGKVYILDEPLALPEGIGKYQTCLAF